MLYNLEYNQILKKIRTKKKSWLYDYAKIYKLIWLAYKRYQQDCPAITFDFSASFINNERYTHIDDVKIDFAIMLQSSIFVYFFLLLFS